MRRKRDPACYKHVVHIKYATTEKTQKRRMAATMGANIPQDLNGKTGSHHHSEGRSPKRRKKKDGSVFNAQSAMTVI